MKIMELQDKVTVNAKMQIDVPKGLAKLVKVNN